MSNKGDDRSGLKQVRDAQMRHAISVRIYGVQLAGADESEGRFVAVRFCGLSIGDMDERTPTSRIWHFPKDSILATGTVSDFKDGDEEVSFFDVTRDADIIEEARLSVVLGNEIGAAHAGVAAHHTTFASVITAADGCGHGDAEPGVMEARRRRLIVPDGVMRGEVMKLCDLLADNEAGHCSSVRTTTVPPSRPGRTYSRFHVNYPRPADSDTGTEIVVY